MSATAKGVVVGAANLFAIALLIAILEASERHWVRDAFDLLLFVQLVGAIPVLAGSAAIGWIAERLDTARRPVIVGIGLVYVVAGGLLTDPKWIYVAAIPTIIWMVRLERWTRRPASDPRPPSSPAACGTIVAGAALAAIAVIAGLVLQHERGHHYLGLEVATEVFVAGLAPTVALGGLLGWLGRRLATASPAMRRFVLSAPMFAVIAIVGYATERSLVLPALVPAFAAALVLERVTRSQLPIARALPGNPSSGAAI